MAYADTARSASATMEVVAGLLDGLVVTYSSVAVTSTISTSSTTAVDYTGASVTISTNVGEAVMILYQLSFSSNTASQTVVVGISQDGVDGTQQIVFNDSNSTTGYQKLISGHLMYAPSAASHTYKLRWFNGSAANLVYSDRARLTAIVFQNS